MRGVAVTLALARFLFPYLIAIHMPQLHPEKIAHRLEQLTELSVALGHGLGGEGHDIGALLQRIVLLAKSMSGADGATLYRPALDGRQLAFDISVNDSLGIAQGADIGVPGVPLFDGAGQPNLASVAAYAANLRRSVNIADVYRDEGFNFSGMREFDRHHGYHTQSILTVPMSDHEGDLIGVLQLVNAKDGETGQVRAFSSTDQRFIEALAAQAGVALTNQLLISQLEELLESLVTLINIGIDEKSPYTGRHCQFVPELTMLLADAAHATQTGPLADFRLSDNERKQLWLAGLLHDCGKITTPVHVVDKATKLETIFDRIALIDTRYEVLLRDAEIAALRQQAAQPQQKDAIAGALAQEQAALREERDFIRRVNIGGESMAQADQERVRQIARRRWRAADGQLCDFLDADETENLTIRAGTLTAAERAIVNNHISVSIRMLEALPWPKHLQKVPEYAGGHHERMDGKGYPRGLTKEQMSVPARLMAIADIFEALTARDRPYKKGKPLSESLRILGNFSLNGHIDPELFDVFIRSKVYLTFAEKHMHPSQIDAVDEAAIPGYTP